LIIPATYIDFKTGGMLLSVIMEKEFYQKLLNCLHDQVAVVDRDLMIIYQNQAFESFLSLNIQDSFDIRSESINSLFPESVRGIVDAVNSCFQEGAVIKRRLVVDYKSRESFFKLIIIPDYHKQDVNECILILYNETDVELKQRELNQQVNFFSKLITRLPIGIYMFDLHDQDVQLTLWNPRMTSFFGFSEKDILGKSLESVFDMETVKRHRKAVHQIQQTRLYYDFPGEYIKSVTGMRYYHTILAPIAQEVDSSHSFLGIMEDVTDKIQQDVKLKRYQKKLMNALKNTSKQLDDTTAEISSILDNSFGISIFSLDMDLCYRVFNSHHKFQIETQFGLTIESGMPYKLILDHQNDKGQEILGFLKMALEGISTSQELHHRLPDGQLTYFDAIFSPLYSQDVVIGVTVVYIDTTKHRRAEKEAETFKTVADNAEYGVMLTDLQLNVRYANAYWENLFNIPIGELPGQKSDVLFPEKQLSVVKETIASLHKNRRSQQIELDLVNRNQDPFTILMNCVLYDDIAGEPGGVAFTCLDITPMKQAEESLILARDNAERASIMKSTFVANMSHEIRTPLNAVLGFAGLMKGRLEEPDMKNYLESILSSGEILKGLINDVLDFSKIEAGKMSYNPVPIETVSFFGEVYTLFHLQAQDKKLIFDFVSYEPLPEILIFDPLRMRQILINLIGNALKFTKWGYIKLFIHYEFNKKYLQFTVADTGLGIPPEDQKSVFDLFEQQDKQEARNFEGTGLGLAITNKLITLMHGKILLKSDRWMGSSFTARIPMEMADSKRTEKISLQEKWTSSDPIFVCYIDESLFSKKLNDLGLKLRLQFIPVDELKDLNEKFMISKNCLLTKEPQKYSEYSKLIVIKSLSKKNIPNQNISNREFFICEDLEPIKKVAVIRSILLREMNQDKRSDLSLENLSSMGLTLLKKALDTKDFTDITEALPALRQCGEEGKIYTDALQDAISSFNISKLNEMLEDLQIKLNNRNE
jgi:PAS domain S-box-containing protein